MVNLKYVLLVSCLMFLFTESSMEETPTLDRWLSVFFREVDRNVSPETLEESVSRNEDVLVLIEYPESLKATFPLGVRLGSKSVCSENEESVAFATNYIPSKSFSVACMKIEGYRANSLGDHSPVPREVFQKALDRLIKLYPHINITLPFTSEEIDSYLREQGYEIPREVEALKSKIDEIQNRENFLHRSIPNLENLHERALKSIKEDEEDKNLETSELFEEIEKSNRSGVNEWSDNEFEDPFFNEKNWANTGDDDDLPEPRRNELDQSGKTNLVDEEKKPLDDEADYFGERESQSNAPESAMDPAFEENQDYDDDNEKVYKTKYETVLGILLTILAVITVIVLIYIYRRQQRSRVFQITGQSTPSSPVSHNERNIFEPQVLQLSKDDPECTFGTENNATIKSGNLLAVKVASSLHSSVSSSRSNPFLGSNSEIPKLDPPPPVSAPTTPNSRHSISSFQSQK